MAKETRATRVTTGKVRLSYVNIFTPKAISDGQDPKYSLCVLIPKKDKKTIKSIEDAIQAAIADGHDKLAVKGVVPKNLKTPLRDGDEERSDDPAYEGCMFMNINSKNKPQVVDADLQVVIDPLEVYSGCYGRVSINFYAYAAQGNKGIAAGLGNVQKLEDGEALGSVVSASADFGSDNDDDI